MKFIHAADLHLDSPLRGLERYEGAPVGELRGATRRALERLVELCLTERAAFLVIAGDVYDGDWDDYNTGLFFHKQMSRLRAAEIPVFLVRGNHDARSRITRELKLPANVHAFGTEQAETVRLEALGVALHGQSYPHPACLEDLSAAYPAAVPGWFNLGVLHTSAGGREGHAPYAPCSLSGLAAKGYDYWALGHVHRREVLSAREPCVVFPGNPQGRDAQETGEKGVTIVTRDASGDLALEHRTLDVVRWSECVLDATSAATSDDVLALAEQSLAAAARSAGKLLAARVIIRGASAAHGALMADPAAIAAQVRALANDLGAVWIEKVKVQTHAPIAFDEVACQASPLGHLVRFTRELRGDDAAVGALAKKFADLREKLPAELAKELAPDDPARIRALLAEIDQLLVPRLFSMDSPA